MTDEKPSALEKAFYIFLLGLLTYGWWRLSAEIRKKIVG